MRTSHVTNYLLLVCLAPLLTHHPYAPSVIRFARRHRDYEIYFSRYLEERDREKGGKRKVDEGESGDGKERKR